MSLFRNKVLSGVFWTLSQQFSVKAINFGVQIILARILLPEAFGLIAMLQVFIAIGGSLMDSGMTSSLIRTYEAQEKDYSTVFFINLLSSIVIYFILFILSPLIAYFYKMPELNAVVRVYSLSIIINALVAVQNARLTKIMNFKLQMFIEIPSVVISGITGILMAYKGFGVWSLVWMNIAGSFVFMVQHWFRTHWRPKFIFDVATLKKHFNFGYKLTFIGMANAIYDNVYNIVIGKFFSATELGFYNRAINFQYFPAKNIGAAMQKVTYSTFAAIQDDNERLRSAYRKILEQSLFWISPLMVTLCVVAQPLFSLVLTAKWLPAVPYFQILTVAGILYPLNQYNLNIIWVKGKSGLLLKLNIWEKVITTLIIVGTLPFGIKAMVIGQSAYSVIALFINSHFSGRFIQYPLSKQLKDISPVLLICSCVGVVIWFVNLYLTGMADWGRIMIICLISGTLYMTSSHLLKITPYLFVRRILLEKITSLVKSRKSLFLYNQK